MPRTPEQFEKIREEKRNHIMDVALELFANNGFHNTSISNIAQAAGMSKGLMYNYFDSKEELMEAIFDKGVNEFITLFDPNKDGVLTTDEFEFFVNRSFDVLQSRKTYWKLYFGTVFQAGIYSMIKDKYEKVIQESLMILVDYYKRQGVKDPESEAILFGAVLDGISVNYILNTEIFPLEKMKKAIIDKFGHRKDPGTLKRR